MEFTRRADLTCWPASWYTSLSEVRNPDYRVHLSIPMEVGKMTFQATLQLDDDMNRTVSKELECEATVLATAITDVAALLTDLAAISDMGLIKVSYVEKDISGAYAETAGANADVGATFRLQLADGNVIAYKIPGFKQSIADGNGKIDPLNADVAAYFANFLAAGAFTVGRGRVITSVLSGQMDK